MKITATLDGPHLGVTADCADLLDVDDDNRREITRQVAAAIADVLATHLTKTTRDVTADAAHPAATTVVDSDDPGQLETGAPSSPTEPTPPASSPSPTRTPAGGDNDDGGRVTGDQVPAAAVVDHTDYQAYRDEAEELLAARLGPATIAAELGIPVAVVRRWKDELG